MIQTVFYATNEAHRPAMLTLIRFMEFAFSHSFSVLCLREGKEPGRSSGTRLER